MRLLTLPLLLALNLLLAANAYAVVITTYPGSTYNSDPVIMDAVLGITGALIEDFEDLTLIAPLSIETEDPSPALSFGPSNSLPQLFAPLSPRAGELGPFANNTWDGSHAFVQGFGNGSINFFGNPAPKVVTFHVADGATSFGVGLANFQDQQFILNDHRLLVNGQDMGLIETLPNYVDGVQVRNLYLRIDAASGESIETVRFEISNNDGLVFDHIALFGAGAVSTEPKNFGRVKSLFE